MISAHDKVSTNLRSNQSWSLKAYGVPPKLVGAGMQTQVTTDKILPYVSADL